MSSIILNRNLERANTYVPNMWLPVVAAAKLWTTLMISPTHTHLCDTQGSSVIITEVTFHPLLVGSIPNLKIKINTKRSISLIIGYSKGYLLNRSHDWRMSWMLNMQTPQLSLLGEAISWKWAFQRHLKPVAPKDQQFPWWIQKKKL